jgi:hypothetical protein
VLAAHHPPDPPPPPNRFTKPTGLYPDSPWDEKAVRRLILEGKLAPRFQGLEEKHKVGGWRCGGVGVRWWWAFSLAIGGLGLWP